MKKNAEARAKEAAQSSRGYQSMALQKHRWVPVRLKERKEVSKYVRSYTFTLPDSKKALGLATCQHVQLGFPLKDRMLIRSYTPTRPVLESEEDGTFELVVKTCFPNDDPPGGALSNNCMGLNEETEVRGPTGEIEYRGIGKFVIEGKGIYFSRVTLILGGSGITPRYQLIARILKTRGVDTKIAVIDANKSEADMLLRDGLRDFQEKHSEQFKIEPVLSHPSDEWEGKKGYVKAELMRKVGFEPQEGSMELLCGPPAMSQKAPLQALKDWGLRKRRTVLGSTIKPNGHDRRFPRPSGA